MPAYLRDVRSWCPCPCQSDQTFPWIFPVQQLGRQSGVSELTRYTLALITVLASEGDINP